MASKITKWHFAPTDFSRQNLLAELVPEARITVTGNTVIDALLWVLGRIDANVAELLDEPLRYAAMSRAHNPYGDGKACERIIAVLKEI